MQYGAKPDAAACDGLRSTLKKSMQHAVFPNTVLLHYKRL